MEELNLISICISAFFAVFVVLSGLAVFMHVITRIFPFKEVQEDSAVYAAIASAMTRLYPGTRLTKIEELK